MKLIAATGGKGGTGKSTFALMLAFKNLEQNKRVLLADCDVECPNNYLLLGIENLSNLIKKTYAYYPKIDSDKCQKCGLCVSKCPNSALFQPPNDIPTLKEDLCSSCGVCWTICPTNAIEKVAKQNGEIFQNELEDNFTLLTGRSIPGVRETSPIVEEIRDYIDEIAYEYDTVIIDTAAGTHCTVMSALDKVDLAYAVTEPTPVGAHDLDLILEVLNVLDVESKIVLNRSDVGNKDIIRNISKKRDTPIAYEIPYDSKLAKVYSNGEFLQNKKLLTNMIKK